MVILLVFASILGGLITVAVLWPFGALLAVLCAPFGGSLMAMFTVGLVALLGPRHNESSDPAWEESVDEMVAALNQVAEQGHRYKSLPPASTGTKSRAKRQGVGR